MQNKKQSLIEAISGTVIGLITSFLIQLVIYPLLNIEVTFGENIVITVVFFIASFIRGYYVRRLFNWFFNKSESEYRLKKAIQTLKEFNEWRRDHSFSMESKMISPKITGEAIDTVVEYYSKK